MGAGSWLHWVVVAVIVVLLFGRGKVSELMGDVAKGIKAFKKGMSDEEQAAASSSAQPSEPLKAIEHQPQADARSGAKSSKKEA
jgi:sec-independent protein translocase protein TatA